MLLVTHNGPFHADDCLAYVILKHALGVPFEFVRTREKSIIDNADIVWDVGGQYNSTLRRYDHHQQGAPFRDNSVPYSSAGLVWRDWGEKAIKNIVGGNADFVKAIADKIDISIMDIDSSDNGYGPPPRSVDLSNMVNDYNLSWDSEFSGLPEEEGRAFLRAVQSIDGFFLNRVNSIRAQCKAHDRVMEAFTASDDPHVLVMNQRMPWKEVAFTEDLPVIYAVFPASSGNWMVDTMPDKPGSFGQKLPLPIEWAGLRENALVEMSGIPDAVFVHTTRFIGACKTKEGAIKMANRALELSETPLYHIKN